VLQTLIVRVALQAANASDFAIAQFAFLKRLLLVHGHWNYVRMCTTIKWGPSRTMRCGPAPAHAHAARTVAIGARPSAQPAHAEGRHWPAGYVGTSCTRTL
jgi:hypothetical protein